MPNGSNIDINDAKKAMRLLVELTNASRNFLDALESGDPIVKTGTEGIIRDRNQRLRFCLHYSERFLGK